MDSITGIGIVAIYLIFIAAQHLLNWLLRLSNQEDIDYESQCGYTFIFVFMQFVWVVLFYAFTSALIETY